MVHLVNIFILTLAWSSMQSNAIQIPSEWEAEFIKNFAEPRADDGNSLEFGTTPQGYSGTPIIFPGTKWCGPGDVSANDNDLGEKVETDKCCRAHDKCNNTIAPGKSKEGLENDTGYTALSCACDNAFFECLDKIDDFTSTTIGNLYFNILGRDCFEADYPLSSTCKEYDCSYRVGIMLYGGCYEYEKDTTKPKVLKWTSSKSFKFF